LPPHKTVWQEYPKIIASFRTVPAIFWRCLSRGWSSRAGGIRARGVPSAPAGGEAGHGGWKPQAGSSTASTDSADSVAAPLTSRPGRWHPPARSAGRIGSADIAASILLMFAVSAGPSIVVPIPFALFGVGLGWAARRSRLGLKQPEARSSRG
jgi:hypothetical protein